jgi:hypothetical protein
MTDDTQELLDEELPEDVDVDDLAEVEEVDPDDLATSLTDDDDDEDGDDSDDDEDEALDELEAEELEMLTEDESTETIVVDEAAEMRAIRRAELALEGDSADEAHSDEFVCTSCFLVKRKAQLANKRKKICFDCAS